MIKNALEPAGSCAIALVVGLLCLQSCWAQSDGARGFQRVPVAAAFDPRFMPFKGASPLENYGIVGSAPWVTLQLPGRAGGELLLHVESLRLSSSAPGVAPRSSPKAMSNPDPAQRIYSAQDVRTMWTNRRVLVGWLDFDNVANALRQKLKDGGSLPPNVQIQALGDEIYAEVPSVAGDSRKLVLKKLSGHVVTPETPAPTWVEPLFHQVFIACVPAERPAKLPLSKEVLGNRYETTKRCGLMSHEGRWLARPEFEYMEFVHGPVGYSLLLLRGSEPCIATLDLPVRQACLGQPLSTLFASGKLPFSRPIAESSRRGGDTIGYVSADGAWAIQPKFREAQAFSANIATVQYAGVPGVIDGSGKWLTPAVSSDPVVARWLVERANNSQISGFGLINRSGQMVIPFLFPKVESVNATSYRVCHQNGCDVIQVPKAPDIPRIKSTPANVGAQTAQTAARWIPAGLNGLWGYQEATGQWVLKPQFEETEPFEGGLAKAKSEGRWGIILPTGKWLFSPDYQSISPFSYGVAIALDVNGNQYLLSADGKQIDMEEGKVFSLFGADGLALAALNSYNQGYVDRTGKWVIKPDYSQVQPFSGGYAVASGKLPEDWRPSNFKEPPYVLRSVHWLSPNVIALRALIGKEERTGLMDSDGNWLVPVP